MIGHQVL